MPRKYTEDIRINACWLRLQGRTYSEISEVLRCQIPKGTLSGWLKPLSLSQEAKLRISQKMKDAGAPGRAIAWQNIQNKRQNLLKATFQRVEKELQAIDNYSSKLCLAMLYLAEGGKVGEWLRFGNSDPKVIQLFLFFLRKSFKINNTKFRGRVQCRADQDVQQLQFYWSKISNIPLSQFGKAQIDPRTAGKPTKKVDYKGVFVVEYCSNVIFLELKYISDIIYSRSTK